MCEIRSTTMASTATIALVSLAVSACVIHRPGLAVDVWIDLPDLPLAPELRATELSLVPCPGEPVDPAHTHEGAETIALETDLRTSLLPTPGRYCDLRIQLESPHSVPRQAVVPLVCGERPMPLVLDAAAVGRPASLVMSAPEPPPHASSPQQRIDAWLRALSVTRADCAAATAP